MSDITEGDYRGYRSSGVKKGHETYIYLGNKSKDGENLSGLTLVS